LSLPSSLTQTSFWSRPICFGCCCCSAFIGARLSKENTNEAHLSNKQTNKQRRLHSRSPLYRIYSVKFQRLGREWRRDGANIAIQLFAPSYSSSSSHIITRIDSRVVHSFALNNILHIAACLFLFLLLSIHRTIMRYGRGIHYGVDAARRAGKRAAGCCHVWQTTIHGARKRDKDRETHHKTKQDVGQATTCLLHVQFKYKILRTVNISTQRKVIS
jgi:hypothetical protein